MPGRTTQESPTETEEDFTGHVKDGSTQLHYAGARYYSAVFGRWTTTDPILGEKGPKALLKQDERLLTMTSYNYTFGNPVAFQDPNGRLPCGGVCSAAIIGAAVGGGIEAAIQYSMSGSVPNRMLLFRPRLVGLLEE
jgi:RHS repeat-associated protein